MATAFAALVSLQNNLRLIQNHPRHSFSFADEQIESLLDSVCLLIEFMKCFNNSHGAAGEAAEAFSRRIARAAHAAEDVIESHVVDQIRAGSTLAGKTTPRFLLDLQKVIGDMNSVITKAVTVQKSLHDLEAEDPKFSTAEAATTAATSSTPLAYEKNRMVGFDDELLHLVDLLTGVPSSRRVIPIVGMGGIGKTTLATNAFQHSYILHYFDVRLWATVSQDYSVQKILTQLLSSLLSQEKENISSKMSTRVTSVDQLGGETLYKSLCGRRYLIILDDMWSVGVWEEIKFFFPDNTNGSRVVVTTRQSYVARHFGSLHLYLSFLDEGNSWDLFCQKTFENKGCRHELQNIGKKIVEKCRGLPLAIVVVGGHLQQSSWTLKYWENVANHMSSILNSAEYERSLDILSLSYRYLPVQLKPCFLFLGVFPEDQEIPVSEVVNLWIDEGLIEQIEDFSLEDIAFAYLENLTERNLISSYGKWVGYGIIRVCRVHDLLRELCLKIAKKDEFLSVLDTSRGINKERRVLFNGRIPKVFHAPRSTPLLRSLMCEGGQLLFGLKLLRVMNKGDSAFLDKASFQQVNLRYLKVDVDYKSYLPSSISLLWNLQTLVITGAFRSIVAPYEIWEMLQLRHIEVDPICLLDPLPIESLDQDNDLVLRKLLTLSRVENIRLSKEVCRRMPNIKKLELSYCNEPSSNYCLHNLGCFKKLESLKCDFDDNAKWGDLALSFTFPSSLRRLNLSECRLGWEDLTRVVGTFPHLEHLLLLQHSVIGSVWTPDEGGFPSLKELFINDCDLIHWIADNSHFPVLQHIFLCSLSELDEFTSGIGEIPTLEWITLSCCSMSSSLSAMRVVAEQEEMGNEGLQFDVSFEGDEETLERFKQKVEEEGLRSNGLHLILENGKTKG